MKLKIFLFTDFVIYTGKQLNYIKTVKTHYNKLIIYDR
jgi:hypothetical protein